MGISDSDVEWAAGVWSRLSRLECQSVLLVSLRYELISDPDVAYISTMARMSWGDLGRPLQLDITQALLRWQQILRRR
jgi:hypothetical protein